MTDPKAAVTHRALLRDARAKLLKAWEVSGEGALGQIATILEAVDAALAVLPLRIASRSSSAPIDMLLFCPRCQMQHVDSPEPERGWTNPPHATHTCKGCGLNWRPSNDLTNGVSGLSSTEAKHVERFMATDPRPYARSASALTGETPRTEADVWLLAGGEYVRAALSRQLERELAEMTTVARKAEEAFLQSFADAERLTRTLRSSTERTDIEVVGIFVQRYGKWIEIEDHDMDNPEDACFLYREAVSTSASALTGETLILAANHEEELRKRYAAMIQYVDDAAKKT